MSIDASPVTVHLWEESAFLFSTLSYSVAVDNEKVHQILLRLSKLRTLSLFLYVCAQASFTIAICWTYIGSYS